MILNGIEWPWARGLKVAVSLILKEVAKSLILK